MCPHCALRNGQELREILNEFSSHQDFHLTCISIDPETDNVDKLKDYASALNADPKNWWFLTTGDNAKAHDYMEGTLKFFKIKQRTDPADIESNGRFAHDLGLALVNKNFEVVGKWPLADARKTDPVLYESLKKDMYEKFAENSQNNHGTAFATFRISGKKTSHRRLDRDRAGVGAGRPDAPARAAHRLA